MVASPEQLREQLASLTTEELLRLRWRAEWAGTARPKQVIDFTHTQLNRILIMSGRGWGKTLVGVNWICGELCDDPGSFGHMIGPTYNDVRYTIIEGESGILRTVPEQLIANYNKSDLVLTFWNGSVLRGFTSEEPERLRGPQCKYLYADEMAAWKYGRETWEQAKFGHRLGRRSTTVITTTPKPKELIRELVEDPETLKIYGDTRENEANLSKTFLDDMEKLRGTRLGRQELEGVLLDPEEEGVIKRSWWKRVSGDQKLPSFDMIVMSLDTASSEANVDVRNDKRDFSACSVWGCYKERIGKGEGSYVVPRVLLLDAWQDKMDIVDLVARVKKEKESRYGEDDMRAEIRPAFGSRKMDTVGRKADVILIEDKASGIQLRQLLRKQGIPVVPFNPRRADKYLRLNLTAPMFLSGYIYGVESPKRKGHFMSWAEPLISQMCSYSGEGSLEHDDLMDSATQALLWIERNWLGAVGKTPTPRRREVENTPDGHNPYAS